MAVVPDKVAAGLDSLKMSIEWMDSGLLPEWNWYLAVQNGMTRKDVDPVLHKFAGIFLGGDDEFKGTAYNWAQLAHKHGKKFHYARAGTEEKFWHAKNVGADSMDSTGMLWSTKLMNAFIDFSIVKKQQTIFGDEKQYAKSID